MLEVARGLAASVPVVLMCYANMVFAPGVEAFVERLAQTGACGLIVPDLPHGEAPEVLEACDAHGLALVPLVAPTTTPERMAAIGARGARVSVHGLGCRDDRGAARVRRGFGELLARAKASTEVPVAIGFGIGTPEQARQAAEAGADGVIVGTRLVRAPPTAPRTRRGRSARSWESSRPACREPLAGDRPSARIRAHMGFVLTVTAGLVVWIVFWALGAKGFDAFLLATLIILIGASLKILSGYLPGRRS